jgi:hypothetical protein
MLVGLEDGGSLPSACRAAGGGVVGGEGDVLIAAGSMLGWRELLLPAFDEIAFWVFLGFIQRANNSDFREGRPFHAGRTNHLSKKRADPFKARVGSRDREPRRG